MKLAVVLFNLGAPDRPEAVQPFLFNLFNDPSILRIAWPFRTLLAHVVSRRRAKEAGKIYDQLGGGSPLLPNTRAQAEALEAKLARDGRETRVFIAMRYWHPMSMETAAEVAAFAPDRIVLLPLYPQFSTTTTASSFRVWRQAAAAHGLTAPARLACCYPEDDGFIQATADFIRPLLDEAVALGRPRLLFSSHGLPESVVRDGDPYQWQCERTAEAVVAALDRDDFDWLNCYQSRVGPMKWIGPSTEDEVRRSGEEKRPVVVAPIAFVSEHSETLVELDRDYATLAQQSGAPGYFRAPTVSIAAPFIENLAEIVERMAVDGPEVSQKDGGRCCPAGFSGCPQAEAAA